MARQIRVDQIDDFFEDLVVDLVEATTLEWTKRVKKETPVDTGRLRNGWQTSIKKFEGSVTNNIEYAEPVCFGVNLPPSWGGQYRTRQGTVAGFPELIGKELELYVMQQIRRAI
tara:strand:+ start:1225 stop:1566 length:342 start_codon:yes stop_codon:yes gene_type:complete